MNIIKRFTVKRLKQFGKAVFPDQLKLTVCDTNPELLPYFIKYFREYDQIEVVEGNLTHISCDAIVSPANSFGDMGGGIDKVIDDYFQGYAQHAVKKKIGEGFYGELPVGMAWLSNRFRRKSPLLSVRQRCVSLEIFNKQSMSI